MSKEEGRRKSMIKQEEGRRRKVWVTKIIDKEEDGERKKEDDR